MRYRVVAILLVIIVLAGCTIDIVRSLNIQITDNAMTQEEKLGSPLTDDSFDKNSWNESEAIVFGIFLSNFVVPFDDNYKTAFSSFTCPNCGIYKKSDGNSTRDTHGSAGKWFSCLNFGSDATNNTLQKMLTYAIRMQQESDLTPIYISKYVGGDAGDSGWKLGTGYHAEGNIGDYPAYLADFWKFKGESGSFNAIDDADMTNVDAQGAIGDFGIGFMYILDGSNANGYKTIFDFADSFDTSTFLAAYSRFLYTKGSDRVEQLYGAMASYDSTNNDRANSAPLYLDCYGNIVAKSDCGCNVIIYPACTNNHIVDGAGYNYLTSIAIGGRYNRMSYTDILNNMTVNKNGKYILDRRVGQFNNSAGIFSSASGSSDVSELLSYVNLDQFKGGEVAPARYSSTLSGSTNTTIANIYATVKVFKGTDFIKNQNKGMYEYLYNIFGAEIDTILANGNFTDSQKSKLSQAILKAAFTSDMNSSNKYAMPLQLVVHGLEEEDTHSWWPTKGRFTHFVRHTYLLAGTMYPEENSLDCLDYFGKMKVNIFDNPMVVPLQTSNSEDSALRKYIRYIARESRTNVNSDAYEALSEALSNLDNVAEYNALDISKEFTRRLFENDSGTSTNAWAAFASEESESGFKSSSSSEQIRNGLLTAEPNKLESVGIDNTRYDSDGIPYDLVGSDYVTVYPKSTLILHLDEYLNNTGDSDEISLLCKSMYYTYLEWFGVIKGSMDSSARLNDVIFGNSPLRDMNIDDVLSFNTMSEEAKKSSILNSTYVMLDVKNGREYRRKLVSGLITDLCYEWYNKMVYGSAIDIDVNRDGSSAAGSVSQGFLGVDNYYDNPFTAGFMSRYTGVVVVLIGIGLAVILVVFALTRKRVSWLLTSIMYLVVVVMIVPSVGDIVPYVSEKMISASFNKQLDYWALCEITENMSTLDVSNIDYIANDSSNTAFVKDSDGNNVTQDLMNLVSDLNMNYADRALLLKYDISRKVTSADLASWSELSKLKSASWVLPQIIRQYSANGENESSYVYVPLSDMLKSCRLSYGMYDGSSMYDAETIKVRSMTLSEMAKYSPGYTNTSWVYGDIINNAVISETGGTGGKYELYNLKPLSEQGEFGETIHKHYYILSDSNEKTGGDCNDAFEMPKIDIWDLYKDIDTTINDAASSNRSAVESLRKYATKIENTAGTYNDFNTTTIKRQFNYLWTTESVLPYMYMNIKDTYNQYKALSDYSSYDIEYDTDINNRTVISSIQIKDDYSKMKDMQNIADMLQGGFADVDSDGDGKTDISNARYGFSYDIYTGESKDVMDLRELFTNVIPYMYKMQTFAGGSDGYKGVFGGADGNSETAQKISSYSLYKGSCESWLFRCNWAEKIMTSSLFSEQQRILDRDGNVYDMTNSAYYKNYPAVRPMIFSYAEMKACGLSKESLSIVELKCCEANKKAADDMTMLINYVNMDGMTPEALLQMMALICTENFCTELSPDNGFSNESALYPKTVDLRNISFDAVARVMMLNATNDTYYVYGNTMYNVIHNSDVFSAVLLLIDTFGCVFLIPFLRNILMALLLFMALILLVYSFFASNRLKFSIFLSYIINLCAFLATNIGFYAALSLFMGTTSTSDILTRGGDMGKLKSPVAVLCIILLIMGVYVFINIRMIKFIFVNHRDLGAAVFSEAASGLAEKISGGLDGIKGIFSNSRFSTGDTGSEVESNIKSSGSSESDNVARNGEDSNVYSNRGGRNRELSRDGSGRQLAEPSVQESSYSDNENSAVTDLSKIDASDTMSSKDKEDIDSKIERGKKKGTSNKGNKDNEDTGN